MKISIIGTGNVATQLALGLEQKGLSVVEVYGRNASKAKALINKLYIANYVSSLDFRNSPADVFIICVSDNAIEEVAQNIMLPPQALLLHTSGSVPMQLLTNYHSNVGILYPLQSISLQKSTQWQEVNLVINCNQENTLPLLVKLASKLSPNVYRYSDEQRKAMHLAAVFGSNFTNHLLKIVKDIADAEGLDFGLFRSLILNTVQKAFDIGPEASQTGPAIRNDQGIIDAHLDMLKDSQGLEELYQMLTKHIQATYQK